MYRLAWKYLSPWQETQIGHLRIAAASNVHNCERHRSNSLDNINNLSVTATVSRVSTLRDTLPRPDAILTRDLLATTIIVRLEDSFA